MSAVVAKLPLSGFIILALLIVQFNSFRKTFIVLSTIPLGLIGVIAGLLVFRSFFGFFAFLGLISLAGYRHQQRDRTHRPHTNRTGPV